MPRTTIEVEPTVLKSIRLIAIKRAIKIKTVADALLRYSLLREDYVFPSPNRNNRDNGK